MGRQRSWAALDRKMGPEPFAIVVLLKASEASAISSQPKRFFGMDLMGGCLVEVEQSKVVEGFVTTVANDLRSGKLRDDLEPLSKTLGGHWCVDVVKSGVDGPVK